MSSPKAKIFIVEDHPMFRERLTQLINGEADMEVVGEADNTDDALRKIRQSEPNLVLVDVRLKQSSGLVLIKTLKAMDLGIPSLVLSMHDETTHAARAIHAGARGFVGKHCASNDLLTAIRTVLAGDVYLSEKAAMHFVRSFVSAGPSGDTGAVSKLTPRELEVLQMIGQGTATREIAESLSIAVASVDTYRARIKEKLHLRNAAELQIFAVKWISEQE
jgi:DNA-binding NarL/FixJ family response regulator